MDMSTARRMAAEACAKISPGDAFCSLTVDGGNEPKFVIWTVEGSKLHRQVLDAANTSQERLEAHLRGFVDEWRKRHNITEYYTDRANSGQAALAGYR